MTAATAPLTTGQPRCENPRERLQGLAREAAYDREVLEAIADAALHPRQPAPGEKATDSQVRHVCAAVDILTTARRTGSQVLTRLNGFRDAGGDWRLEFWRAELAEASRQWNLRQSQTTGADAAARATAESLETVRGLAGIAGLSDGQLFNVLAGARGGRNVTEEQAAGQLEDALAGLPAALAGDVISQLRAAAAEELADAAHRAGADRNAAHGG